MSLHSGLFECKAQYRGKNDTLIADMTVLPKLSYVPPPHINTTLARNAMKGDPFTLICSVMVDFSTLVDLTWTTPNPRAIADHRISEPATINRNLSWPGTHLKLVEQVINILHHLALVCTKMLLRSDLMTLFWIWYILYTYFQV